MMAQSNCLLIFILIYLAPCRAFDSEGSEFWTAFIANKAGQPGQNSLIFFNNKDVDSDVTISFRNFTADLFNPPQTSLSITVPAKSDAIPFPLPNYLTTVGLGPSFSRVQPIGIQITASSPIRVFGQSTINDGTSGDLFLILPTAALGKEYVVALNQQPVPHNFGSNVIAIVTQNDTNATFSDLLLQAGDVWMLSSSVDDVIVTNFSADKPLAVTAGSECSGFAQGQCDYRAFMPLPTRCNSIQSYLDSHPVLNLLSVVNTYTIAAECGGGSSFQVDGTNGGQLDGGPILNYQFPASQTNNTHLISVGDPLKPVQVTRTNPAFGGSIVVPVLSDSQYVNNELVNFFVPQVDNNYLQITADMNSRNTAKLDNLTHPEWIWNSVLNIIGPTFYITTTNVTAGSHIFEANGLFTITVFGYGTNSYSYAYVPALNTGQQDVTTTIATTTTTSTTTSSTTPISTSSVATSTQPAVTTASPTPPAVTTASSTPSAVTTASSTLPGVTTASSTSPAASSTSPAGTTASSTSPAASSTSPAGTTASSTSPAGTTASSTSPAGTTASSTSPAGTTASSTPPVVTTASPSPPVVTTASSTSPAITTGSPSPPSVTTESTTPSTVITAGTTASSTTPSLTTASPSQSVPMNTTNVASSSTLAPTSPSAYSTFDSEGTDFWTAFIPNQNGDGQKRLIFFNNGNVDSNVVVTFKNLSLLIPDPPTVTLNINVPAKARQVPLDLPSYLQFPQNSGFSWSEIPEISVHITATNPLRLFAQNILTDGSSGDIYTVLPVSALGTTYHLVLNRETVKSPFGANRILLIITQNNTDVSFSHDPLNEGSVYQLSPLNLDTDDSIVMTFSTNKPVAMVAGTPCYGFAQGQCDHRAFMQLPSRCGDSQGYIDYYPVLNLRSSSNSYIIAPECFDTGFFNVDGINAGVLPNLNYQFSADGTNTTHVITATDPGHPIQLTRTNPDFGGSILVPVLETRQYVTNAFVDFFVPEMNNNFIQIIADSASQATATLDDVLRSDFTWIPVQDGTGPTAYSVTEVNVTTGSHTFTAAGRFTITVFGYGTSSYAYSPALNTGQFDITTTVPTTTTIPTTSSTTTAAPATTASTPAAASSSSPASTQSSVATTASVAQTSTSTMPSAATSSSPTATTSSSSIASTQSQATTTSSMGQTSTSTMPSAATSTSPAATSTSPAASSTSAIPTSTISGNVPPPSSIDSEGTEFWTAFIANKDGTGDKTLIVFNNKNVQANIAITYKNFSGGWEFELNKPDITIQYTVPVNGRLNVPIPSNLVNPTGGDGFNLIPPIGINVISDSPVTIFAQNILPDSSSGDIFTVLPITALGTTYYIPLSNSNTTADFSNRVIIVPTQNNTQININGVDSVTLNIQDIYQFGADGAAAFSFSSSQPVAVIAGTQCLNLGNDRCDYRAFMQLPSRCGVSADIFDTHPVKDFQDVADEYTFAAECPGTTPFSVDGVATASLNQNSPIHIWGFNQNANAHVVSVNTNNDRFLQLIRTLPSFGGSIIAPVLSVKQYVSNTSLQFFAIAQTANNFVQIAADDLAISTSLLDSAPQSGLVWRLAPQVNGYRFSFATTSIGPGTHSFSAYGTFSLTVYGYTNGSLSYAYIPAYNTGQIASLSSTSSTSTSTFVTSSGTAASTTLSVSSSSPTATTSSSSPSSIASTQSQATTSSMGQTSTSTSPTTSPTSTIPTPTISGNVPPPSAIDSEGTEFWTAFIANRNGTGDKTLIVFNNKNVQANIAITYKNFSGGWEFELNKPDITIQYTVPVNGRLDIPIPSNLVYPAGGDGWNLIPPIGINIKSDSPVTIFAQNILPDSSSGDIFTVLPVTALGTTYYIPLSNSNTTGAHSNRAFIVPTQNNTQINITGDGSSITLNIQDIYQYGADGAAAFSFSSSQPVAVIAGTQCLNLGNDRCDYRAFMQLPSRCGVSADIFDTHPVKDFQDVADEYTFAAECPGITPFSVDGVATASLNQNNPIHIWGFNQNANAHVVSVNTNNDRFLQLIRTLPSFGGSIIAPVLSVKQYVSNTSLQFFAIAQAANNFVQIVADDLAISTSLLDSAPQSGLQWRLAPLVNGYRFSFATVPIVQGTHTFSAFGTFSLTVYGYTNGSLSYAYIPAFNTGQITPQSTTPSLGTSVSTSSGTSSSSIASTTSSVSSSSSGTSSSPTASSTSIISTTSTASLSSTTVSSPTASTSTVSQSSSTSPSITTSTSSATSSTSSSSATPSTSSVPTLTSASITATSTTTIPTTTTLTTTIATTTTTSVTGSTSVTMTSTVPTTTTSTTTIQTTATSTATTPTSTTLTTTSTAIPPPTTPTVATTTPISTTQSTATTPTTVMTTTTPQPIIVTNSSNIPIVLSSSEKRNFMLENVNTTAGLTLALTVTNGILMLSASICASYNPQLPYLNTTIGVGKVYLTTAMLQDLYDNTATCLPPSDGTRDVGDSMAVNRQPIDFLEMPANLTIYTIIQGGVSASNAGTFTTGDGDVPVDGAGTTQSPTTQSPTTRSPVVEAGGLSTAEIVLIAVGGVLLIAIVLVAFVLYRRHRKQREETSYDVAQARMMQGTVSQVFVD